MKKQAYWVLAAVILISGGAYGITKFGATWFTQVLSNEGENMTPGNAGYSFYQDGAYDTGMFSPSDGVLDFFTNGIRAERMQSGNTVVMGTFTASNGGTLSGSFSGTPVFTGSFTASGGGSLTGTFSGSPTFSGNPTFTGTSLFNNVNVSGALNVSGGGSLTGTFGGNPVFTNVIVGSINGNAGSATQAQSVPVTCSSGYATGIAQSFNAVCQSFPSPSSTGSGYYFKLGGLIIQWGKTGTFDTGPITVTLPTAFSDTSYEVTATNDDGCSGGADRIQDTSGYTTTSFSLRNSGTGCTHWIAVGH